MMMMAKQYDVAVPFAGVIYVTVEAENGAEAIQKAEAKAHIVTAVRENAFGDEVTYGTLLQGWTSCLPQTTSEILAVFDDLGCECSP